jgi:hypothetical protein
MKLFNNTPNIANYDISYENDAECGSIAANATIDMAGLDNQKNVKISFYAAGKAPPGETAPFSMTIPDSGTGMSVTIGLYQE